MAFWTLRLHTSEGSQTQWVQNLFCLFLHLPILFLSCVPHASQGQPTTQLLKPKTCNSFLTPLLLSTLMSPSQSPTASTSLICLFPFISITIAIALGHSLIISCMDYHNSLLLSLTLVIFLNSSSACHKSGFPKTHISSCSSIGYGTCSWLLLGIKFKLLML